MDVFSARERHFLSSVAAVSSSNPFLPERMDHERAALGREFVPAGPVWSASVSNPDATRSNVRLLHDKLHDLIEELHLRLAAAPDLSPEDLAVYEESVYYLLYQRYYA